MMNRAKNCACDFVVELTSQYSLIALQDKLEHATKHILDLSNSAWDFTPKQLDDSLYHVEVEHITNNGKSTVHLFYEDNLCAVLTLGSKLTKKQFEQIETIGKIYLNQLKHITLCNYDQLTGVFNRQAFNERMKQVCSKPTDTNRRRQQTAKTLALIDIDHFKRINDDFGHLLGDEVLVIMGQKFLNTFREDDMCFRYGGEEFAVLLSGVNELQAFTIVSRFRKSIETHNFPQIGKITISAGIAQYHNFMQPSELIEKADRALYYSKDNGRNTVHCYQNLIDEGKIIDKFGGSELELL